VSASTTTAAEVGYLSGVTSAIQTQINTKAPTASPTFTGTVTIPTPFTIGAVSMTATGTQLNYVAGVTSAIQTQLDSKSDGSIPQNSQSTAYTTVIGDANKHILHPTADNNARTFTIAANASVAYPIGTAITFVNQINTVTIAINSDTLTLAGPGTTGSRTLAAKGMATALKIGSTDWIISGTGLT
jgi:hypothetical protein